MINHSVEFSNNAGLFLCVRVIGPYLHGLFGSSVVCMGLLEIPLVL